MLVFVAQADVQFAQLFFVHRRRGLCQQALCSLSLRERDYVTDRVCSGHHRYDTIETECDTAVRRRTKLEDVKQEAELLTSFFWTDLERGEDLALDRKSVV